MTIKQILNKYFGYDTFRPGQEEIINAIINGKNVLAILPTGAGKSLCYQIPAFGSEDYSIVISPLIALMKDQVDSLNKNERVAAFINSTLDYSETEKVLNEIAEKKIKLLYLAPEKLENRNFTERIKGLKPAYLFVDEAHCISEWGHNFRPSYRRIKEFTEFLGLDKISAFTATATEDVRKDIIEQLSLKDPIQFVRGFERTNLHLNVIKTNQKKEKTLELIKRHGTPAIVYTSTRKNTEELTDFLRVNGTECVYYHAGLAPELRRIIQDDFAEGRAKVIAATNAFGMGIDKSDIRLIVHYNMPGTIENYYQEIGRAGRDGGDSHIYLLYENRDKSIQEYFINNSYPTAEQITIVYQTVCDYGRVAVGSVTDKEIQIDTNLINLLKDKGISRSLLNSALTLLEEAGYLKTSSEMEKRHFIRFIISTDQLKSYVKRIATDTLNDVVIAVLREYGSEAFSTKVRINIEQISELAGLAQKTVTDTLSSLADYGIIDYDRPLLTPSIRLTSTRVDIKHLNLDPGKLSNRFVHSKNKLDRMVQYIYTDECRFKYILEYFGDDVTNYKCGKCDICTGKDHSSIVSVEYVQELILTTVHESNMSIRDKDLVLILSGIAKFDNFRTYSTFGSCKVFSKEEITSALQSLADSGFINLFKGRITLADKGKNYFTIFSDENNEKEIPHNNTNDKLELFNLLRQARKEASQKYSQPPQFICSDEILRETAKLQPVTPSALMSIKGFNERMFNKIGEEFLSIIKEYKKKGQTNQVFTNKNIPQNVVRTHELVVKKYSLEDIASLTKLPEAIVSMQIESILEMLPELEINSLFEKKELKMIYEKIDSGITELKVLKENLPSSISYAKIRIALAKRRVI